MNTETITISLPQIHIVTGELEENLISHLNSIKQSSLLGAHLVVFPELSLTGYELPLAQKLAFSPGCDAFKRLSQSAIEHNITVIAGCPLSNTHGKPEIAAVICFADGNIEYYRKQYLHDGEHQYCSAGDKDYLFTLAGYRIALAICADFSEAMHTQRAAQKGADIYIVSALISEAGYINDAAMLSDSAASYNMPVLLANHISHTGGWNACGKNSVWGASSAIVGCSDTKQPCLLLCSVSGDNVTSDLVTPSIDAEILV